MSIQPIKPEGVSAPAKPKAQAASGKSAPSTAAPASPADRVEIESQDHLLDAVRQEPAARPEVVERAQALANDPSYPSGDVLSQVAQRLLGRK